MEYVKHHRFLCVSMSSHYLYHVTIAYNSVTALALVVVNRCMLWCLVLLVVYMYIITSIFRYILNRIHRLAKRDWKTDWIDSHSSQFWQGCKLSRQTLSFHLRLNVSNTIEYTNAVLFRLRWCILTASISIQSLQSLYKFFNFTVVDASRTKY